MPSGYRQGKVGKIPDQTNVREKSGNFTKRSGKNQILRKVREYFYYIHAMKQRP